MVWEEFDKHSTRVFWQPPKITGNKCSTGVLGSLWNQPYTICKLSIELRNIGFQKTQHPATTFLQETFFPILNLFECRNNLLPCFFASKEEFQSLSPKNLTRLIEKDKESALCAFQEALSDFFS